MSLHGLLLIHKTSGPSSHDIVGRARKILKISSIGHAGTLDPLASGLMVLLVGEATKVSQYILEKDKSYEVGVRLGITTDTLDITGQTLSESPVQVSRDEVVNAALALKGEMQVPVPSFSAVKVNGKSLYKYAREGQEVEAPIKAMNFYNVSYVNSDKGNSQLCFHIDCSKGTFIRSWVSMLGEKVGCGAAMESLVRTKSEPFALDQAITLDELERRLKENPHLFDAGSISESSRTSHQNILPETNSFYVSLDEALSQYKTLRVQGQSLVLIRNGQISHELRSRLISTFQPGVDEMVKIVSSEDGLLQALVGVEPNKGLVIKRGFRYN